MTPTSCQPHPASMLISRPAVETETTNTAHHAGPAIPSTDPPSKMSPQLNDWPDRARSKRNPNIKPKLKLKHRS